MNAALLAIVLGLLAVSVPLASLRTEYSAYNDEITGIGAAVPDSTFWGGPVRFNHGPLAGLSPDDALLIVGQRLAYSQLEVNAFRTFLELGGRAVVADDVGSGRGLVSGLGIGLDIPATTIFSTSYERSPRFPIGTSTGVIPGMPETVVMERPHIVTGPGVEVVQAHPFTWIDLDNDLQPDLREPRGPWALARLVQIGQGQLLVIGDPDVLAGSLEELGGASAVLAWLGAGRTIVVDEGHRATTDPVGMGPILAGAESRRIAVIGAIAVSTLLLWAIGLRLRRVRRRRIQSSDPVLAAALAELPP